VKTFITTTTKAMPLYGADQLRSFWGRLGNAPRIAHIKV